MLYAAPNIREPIKGSLVLLSCLASLHNSIETYTVMEKTHHIYIKNNII